MVTNTAFPAADNVDRFYDLYIYDSTNDAHELRPRPRRALDGRQERNRRGRRTSAPATGPTSRSTLTGARAGQTAGFYLKAIEIAPDSRSSASTSRRSRASNATYNALGAAGSAAFEETLATRFPTSTAADFAPLEAGIVDEDTYVEQGLKWKDAHFALPRLHPRRPSASSPDLLLLGNPVTDEFSAPVPGLITPTDMDGDPNPYFDDVTNDDVPDGRAAIREGYIRVRVRGGRRDARARPRADGRRPDDVRLVRPRLRPAVVRGQRREGARRRWVTGAEQTSNCRAVAATLVEGVPSGRHGPDLHRPRGPRSAHHGSTGVRRAAGPAPTTRRSATRSSTTFTEPDRPGQSRAEQVVLKVMKKEELRDVDGTDALHPNRCGDVVVVFGRRTSTDAATPGPARSRSASSSASTATCRTWSTWRTT